MTDKLPPNLLKLFAPRPALPYLSPLDKPLSERKGPYLTGVGSFLQFLDKHGDGYMGTHTAETLRKERIARRKVLAEESRRRQLEAWCQLKESNGAADQRQQEFTRDPFSTLFVARLPSSVTEQKLKEFFEQFGRIVSVKRVINSRTKKPRRYAFIEFEKQRDADAACREASGLRLEGQRILVDIERGRTVRDWKPRRLGGGVQDRHGAPPVRFGPAVSGGGSGRPTSSSFNRPPPMRRESDNSDFYRKRERSPLGGYRQRSKSPKRRR